MKSKVILSSPSKERLIKLLNTHFYSTSYSINEECLVTWKGGVLKEDLIYKVKRGRHQILSNTFDLTLIMAVLSH